MYPGNNLGVLLEQWYPNLRKWMLLSLLTGLAVFVVLGLLEWAYQKKKSEKNPLDNLPFFYFPVSAILIFAAWVPCYLAFYPGIVSYDAGHQTEWIYGGYEAWTQHQPVLHTWLWSLCIRLGEWFQNMELSVIIYSLGQMGIMAAICGYCVYWILKYLNARGIAIFALVFFALCPMNAIMSMIMVKDVLFAGMWLLLTLKTTQLFMEAAKGSSFRFHWPSYGIICFFTMMLRHNAAYVVAVLAAFLFVWWCRLRRNLKQKEADHNGNDTFHIRSMILVFSVCFCIYYFFTGILFPSLGMEASEPREKLSIPLMQMVKVSMLYQEKLPSEEIELLGSYVDLEEAWKNYNPRFGDRTKSYMYVQDGLTPLMRLWAKWMVRYPKEYLEVFLGLHLPFWFIRSEFPDAYSERQYIEVNLYDYHDTIARKPVLPGLYVTYSEIADFSALNEIPVVRIICGIAFPFSFLLFALLITLWKKDKNMLSIIFLQFLLFATYFLGPVSNFRYIYSFFLCYPVYLAAILLPSQELHPAAVK